MFVSFRIRILNSDVQDCHQDTTFHFYSRQFHPLTGDKDQEDRHNNGMRDEEMSSVEDPPVGTVATGSGDPFLTPSNSRKRKRKLPAWLADFLVGRAASGQPAAKHRRAKTPIGTPVKTPAQTSAQTPAVKIVKARLRKATIPIPRKHLVVPPSVVVSSTTPGLQKQASGKKNVRKLSLSGGGGQDGREKSQMNVKNMETGLKKLQPGDKQEKAAVTMPSVKDLKKLKSKGLTRLSQSG